MPRKANLRIWTVGITAGIVIVAIGTLFVPNLWESYDAAQISKAAERNSMSNVEPQPSVVLPELRPLVSHEAYPRRIRVEPLLNLDAAAFAVYDVVSLNELVSKEGDMARPIASLTKLFSASIVFEEDRLNNPVVISELDTRAGGKIAGLKSGQIFSVLELLKAALVGSNNDAMFALGRSSASIERFVLKMNMLARRLNLKNTHFDNPLGFDSQDNYSSARDLVMFAKYLLDRVPEIWEIMRAPHVTIVAHNGAKIVINNTTLLVDTIPGLMGIKTGQTSEAGGSMLMVTEIGRARLVFVVLGAEDRDREMTALYEWVKRAYEF